MYIPLNLGMCDTAHNISDARASSMYYIRSSEYMSLCNCGFVFNTMGMGLY